MPTSPPSLSALLAVADPVRYEILVRLLEESTTQKKLGTDLGLSSGSVSRHVATLVDAGLVTRQRSHGPCEVRFPRALVAVLQAAADLQAEVATAQAEAAIRHMRGVRIAHLEA